MRPRPRVLAPALAALALLPLLGGRRAPTAEALPQEPAPGPASAPTVGVTASRVAVDLVVRDGKGRLVRDLDVAGIELLEDGAPQEVLSLRLVDTMGGARALPASAGARPAPTAAAPAGGAPADTPAFEEQPLFLAFLFDRLAPQARRTAHDAAIDWLARPSPARRHVGVFRIDQSLETLQSFSEDRRLAEEAVHLLLESTPTTYRARAEREQLRGLRQAMLGLGGVASPAGGAGSTPAEFSGLEVGAGDLASGSRDRWSRTIAYFQMRAQVAMLEASEALERDQQGLTTVNSILALVNGLKAAPGRKAVIFFSEGLVLPPRVIAGLRSIVAEANRSGITFYAVDAGGLRTVSAADEARRELAGIVGEIRQGEQGAAGGPGAPSRPMTKALERNEDVLRSDPASGLGTLARETGGFLVRDTNDIARSLRPAEEDLASYYLLEYSPANELWDGRFRRIEVKVRRKDVHVQARQGYFAVRTPLPTPLLDFEAPVIAALEMAPGARDLAFRASVLQVPDQEDESAVPVLVEVPGDAVTLDRDEKAKTWRQDFTAVVLVRDAEGRVVRKVSRRYASEGPLEKAEEARRARVLLLRETWLPAGRYSVQVAVQDAASGRLGVLRTELEVPATPEPALRASGLVVIGHASARGEGPPEAPALVTQGMQLYPSAAGEASVASGRPLAFFLVAKPVAGRAPLQASVELRGGETPVFAAPAELAHAVGRSTLLGGVPLAGVAPGEYELRVTLADGVDRAVRWAKVTIAP